MKYGCCGYATGDGTAYVGPSSLFTSKICAIPLSLQNNGCHSDALHTWNSVLITESVAFGIVILVLILCLPAASYSRAQREFKMVDGFETEEREDPNVTRAGSTTEMSTAREHDGQRA